MSSETPIQEHLIEVEPDWKETWRGMPEFRNEDMRPSQSILVHFRNDADRQAFADLVGQRITARTAFIWHPKAEILFGKTQKFVTEAPVDPRYPVYVPTKSRFKTPLTINALERMKVP